MSSSIWPSCAAFDIPRNTVPLPVALPLTFSGLTVIESVLVSGTFVSLTVPGTLTLTGSFLMNVEVSMKNVNSRVITSDIGVMSIQTSLFLIFTLPIADKFLKG